jgi:DNA-directed RNA polymerase subunit H
MDSNSTIKKINQSRYNLTKYLSDEWKTQGIKEYSDIEIAKIYKSSQHVKGGIHFGAASGCNISLYHKLIPSHQLHIIYYNFPEIGQPSVKINKMCADKLNKLYSDEIIQPDDSIIVVLLNPVPETLENSIEELYNMGQEELIQNNLNEVIHSENEKLNEDKYTNFHFKNIHVYHLDTLSIDILQHSKVPKHEIIRKQGDIQNICEKCNCRPDQLPVIQRSDAVGKRLRIAPGDICKITRITNTAGETEYYRICK